MKEGRAKSGIQRKYMKYTVALLLLALLLSSVGVWFYLHGSLTDVIIDKYTFMSEKMGRSLDALYQKTDEVTAECILYDDVQKSLNAGGLEEVERSALSKYFAYIDLDDVAEYCYVDNKQNVYTRSYSKISYKDFKDSGFEELLKDSYADTKWFWTEDTLFGTGHKALFVGRYVRSMEYAHEPGMLFLKMEEDFLPDVIGDDREYSEEVVAGILDAKGNVCVSRIPEGYEFSDSEKEKICQAVKKNAAGMVVEDKKMSGGVLSAYRQEESGLTVFILVPRNVLNNGMGRILLVMAGIYLFVMLIAANLSVFFSKRFTKPIREISEAMTGFNGNDFSRIAELHTNTELDQIGSSYNEMLGNIEKLVAEIKEQERELRTSEVNMLISQINPHFLYNTLDTIYMLARLNKEETTMRMIQALSKYLRLSLSKGREIVTVEDELENVKSYMEIQQIRNADLFRYEIDCQVDAGKELVLKLILQPIVENAIKYGFRDIFEGGIIRIQIQKDEKYLVFCIYNNGTPIEEEMRSRVNALAEMPFAEMKECFPDKRHGYGVINIVTRLRLKYEEDIQFYFTAEENGTKCVIRVPEQGEEVVV